MEYVTIYEFVPKSFQIYPLIISISIFVIGIIGYRSVRKHGFINVFLVKMPFSQTYMNKIFGFFTFSFVVIGAIGLVITIIQMTGQIEIKKEFDKASNYGTIESTEVSLHTNISIIENIKLKKNLLINGQEFVFSKAENEKGHDLPQNIRKEYFSDNALLRITFINIDRQNIILKIEKKNY